MTYHWPDLDQAARIAVVIDLRDAGKRKDEIAEALNVDVATLHSFAWAHGILGLSVRSLDRSRVAMVPDNRMVDPKAWEPLGPTVSLEHNTGCCWPVDDGSGEFKQCGLHKAKGSYCEHHNAIAYGKARPLRKENIDWLANADWRGSDRVTREEVPAVRTWKTEDGDDE